MIDDIIFSLNAIVPIFLLICLGYFLKWRGMVTDSFLGELNKIMFNICLPCLLFKDIYASDFKSLFDIKTVTFAVIGITIAFVLSWVSAVVFVKDKTMHGSFIQGCFRGNFALLGLPIIINVFGNGVASKIAIILAVGVLLYNIYSVIALLSCAPDAAAKGENKIFQRIIYILKCMVKNPLIIAIVMGMLVALSGIRLPQAIIKPVGYLGNATVAMSLIVIGGSFDLTKARERFGVAMWVSVIKTVITPAVAIPIAVLAGFRGEELGILSVLFATPTAVNSYTMARETGNDDALAASIVVITTIMSVFSVFFVIYLLKTIGLLGI